MMFGRARVATQPAVFTEAYDAKRDAAGLAPEAGGFMPSTRVPTISAAAERCKAGTIAWVMEVKVPVVGVADSVPTSVARTTDQ